MGITEICQYDLEDLNNALVEQLFFYCWFANPQKAIKKK